MTESPLEIYSPVVKAKKGEYKNLLLKLHQQGYMRARIDGTLYWLEETVELDKKRRHTIECLIDRMKVREGQPFRRLSEAGGNGAQALGRFRAARLRGNARQRS